MSKFHSAVTSTPGSIIVRLIVEALVLILLETSRAQPNDITAVQQHGALTATAGRLIDQNGNQVVLRGMSLFWSQWEPEFYNANCVRWLRDDWNCNVVRAAMAFEDGGYLTNPSVEKAKVKTIIDACIDVGIYVIVDWHDHHAEQHQAQAIAFFEEIAREYGHLSNIIYEIYNEPETTSWSTVRAYSDAVIRRIRAIDPDNMIIVGTPWWSQDVDVASENPLPHNNLAYAVHFYAATHKDEHRDKAQIALDRGLTLFASEFGTTDYLGTGPIDHAGLSAWFNLMENNGVSWCNWAVADNLGGTSAALKAGASPEGGWPTSMLTASGNWVREKLRASNSQITAVTSNELPHDIMLYQNYPNPFNPRTLISFELSKETTVKVVIHNLLGQQVTTLLTGTLSAGNHSVPWNGKDASGNRVPSGMYAYRLSTADGRTYTRMMVLMK
ncbi:MAG: cellulase family glycosylhydrolase [Ignavibacteriae bacterium]|nr:cellulase family glycosylhydrolase [Ignavibacteriota bacterium]